MIQICKDNDDCLIHIPSEKGEVYRMNDTYGSVSGPLWASK
jgi:hypothetical protein